MIEPRYMFIKFKNKTTVQVSEISHIIPDKTSQHPLWKMRLKDGTIMFLTKSEYKALLKAFDDSSYSIGLVELDSGDAEDAEDDDVGWD